jgi:hypothetical protein
MEGVIEVKGVRRDTFDAYGLKQLSQWRQRGVLLENKDYKPIFVGAAGIDRPPVERPDPFDKRWGNQAELLGTVGLLTDDLYRACVLHAWGQLDGPAFWRAVFSTNGIFDGSALKQQFEAAVAPEQDPWRTAEASITPESSAE